MPYINVDEAYVLDNTGLQVDQAVDYGLYNANRNLLDNWWWGNPINQRGVTSANYTNAYAIDRWKSVNIMSVNVTGLGYIILTNAYSSGASEFIQKIPMDLRGRTVTMSVKLSDGSVYSKTGTVSTDAFYGNLPDSWAMGVAYATSDNTTRVRIISPNNTSSTIQISGVKLELGSYSTLVNELRPNYVEELQKCQRYFLRLYSNTTPLGFGFTNAAGTYAYILIPTPTEVRNAITTVSLTGSLSMKVGGTGYTISSYSVSSTQPNGINLTATGTFAGNQAVCLYGSASSYLDISAEP